MRSEWAQVIFQPPPVGDTLPPSSDKSNEDKLDKSPWYFYLYPNDKLPSCPSFQGTTSREKSKLVAIIKDVTTAMYSPLAPQLSAHHILHLYGRFLTWRDDLPVSIGNTDKSKGQVLPHAVSLLYVFPIRRLPHELT